MAQTTDQVTQHLAQLNAARNLVLSDSALYPQIANGILPIVGPNSRVELRRWGLDFLAETFANPMLAAAQKEQLARNVLAQVHGILVQPETDIAVLQSLVQLSSSLYPLVFRHMYVALPWLVVCAEVPWTWKLTRAGRVNHPDDTKSWETMNAIKQDILRKMDNYPCSVKICCVKFLQRVVQVQSPGLISDPRVSSARPSGPPFVNAHIAPATGPK